MRGAKTFLIGVLLAAVLLAAVPVTAGAASSSTEMRRKLLSLTNSARRNNGLRALTLNWRLSRDALAHSRRMAERHTVYHTSNLYRLVKRWRPSTWGENVGMAGTVRRVHRAFMRSSGHRSNILRGGFSHVGIGVTKSGGRIWATVMFYGG
ncbi:MAG: CAP domain-containing protein [Actinomycetota bacterium]|nr:CAP domain-containing protein [Actinomycetota bacterium]MDH5313112.1 CAP domain-containing protein [Actinomycetota bacterium]